MVERQGIYAKKVLRIKGDDVKKWNTEKN